MTQPFITAELDAIIKEAEIQSRLTGYVAASLFDRMAAAARSAIPRPIADAPRDGTEIDVFDSTGKRYAKVKWSKFFNKWAQFAGYVGGDSAWGELQIEPVSFLPTPKCGAS